ncbi:MAG: isochorismate synthase [Chloroflexi bacterium]|nr:isochorismate synthase [Chloroflexota bacterium]
MDARAQHNAPLNQRYGRLLSCSIPCSGLNFAGFLAAAEGGARFYWESQSGAVAFAGSGTAVELIAWGEGRYQEIERRARQLFDGACLPDGENRLTRPQLFGGFSFRGDFTPDNTWSIYAPAIFVLPHYQLVSSSGQMWLTINTQIPLDEDPAPLMPDLRAALHDKLAQLKADAPELLNAAQSDLESIDYPMSADMWARMITSATDRIRAGRLNKVVLARAAELRFSGRIRILPILRYLAKTYADCYRFLFEARPYHAFYGASPELLVSVQGKRLATMALAGSIGRGSCVDEDQALGKALMNSAKDRLEHQIVVDKLRDRLAPLTETLEIPPVELLKLSNIQHLNTPISGVLKRPIGILPLVEALHPTPAMGGDPREDALQLIRQLEPIPRGWYGAPVGRIDARLEGEFAVAIRSAVAQESRAWIYAGGGIVAESQPDLEWEESALKFRPMLDAHGSGEK